MFTLDTSLLKKKFSKIADPDYPDQEVYPNLPADNEGLWQPVVLGHFAAIGPSLHQLFLESTPVKIIDPGIDVGSGRWRARKFKICQKIKDPESGFIYASPDNSITVLRYQGQNVSVMLEGVSGGGNHFQMADSNTEIQFHNTAAGEMDNEAVIRVYGTAVLDLESKFTGTFNTPIIQIPHVIHLLMVCFANISNDQIDQGAFQFVGQTKGGASGTFSYPDWFSAAEFANPIRAYFDEQIQVQEVIDTLAFSVGHKVTIDSQGRYTLRKINTITSASTLSVTDGDIFNFEERYRLDSFKNRILVKYFQIPAGDQEAEFDITKRKRKKKRKLITAEIDQFRIVRNKLTRTINGVDVRDDLLEALHKESPEFEVITYWYFPTLAQQCAQDLADYLYKQWGRGNWQVKFEDTSGTISAAVSGDLVVVYRNRSAHGDISTGKAYRLIDATGHLMRRTTSVQRMDEVKI